MKCSWCDVDLNEEEEKSPYLDGDDPMCDECYHNNFEFTCCKCENYDHEDYQGGIGCLFVIIDDSVSDENGPLTPGIYEVTEHPYYITGMIGGGWLWSYAIKKVSDSTHGINSNHAYSMDHLCRECSEQIRKEITSKGEVRG